MEDCLFCKIAQGEMSAAFVYEDDYVVIFNDISPQAPIHLLAVPKKHISSVDALSKEDGHLVGHIFLVIAEQMRKLGMNSEENGYRIVTNTGRNGGQTVDHIHFHVLAGRNLQWPPG